ncbi:PIG-L family deacetylase [Pontibacter litorisediminis]|uniref:PIG-L family deacetylase n=1 Tax=Pontibacter litorisediminis TaxID=1846260 RepID=UPI0023EC95C5|nr:PIG-L family deacetylase [Pontibacter litorisediminis]
MRKKLSVSLVASIALLAFACNQREDVTQFAPVEVYPQDSVLSSLPTKKAMVIVAHDDDMSAMTGTISKLNKEGWEIRAVSFPQTQERNEAHLKACQNILDAVTFFDLKQSQYRNDLDTNEYLYQAIPKEAFSKVFNYAPVEKELVEHVNEFQPSVIFTLDNEIGAYGHPEHVFLSQMVLDLTTSASIKPSYIYQNVYTDHMEATIMERLGRLMQEWGFPGNGWEVAKQSYKVNGMPEPSVQVNIADEAQAKMDYLKSYNESERKTIGLYIPAFEDYSAEEYFRIFDREFFRVIKVN